MSWIACTDTSTRRSGLGFSNRARSSLARDVRAQRKVEVPVRSAWLSAYTWESKPFGAYPVLLPGVVRLRLPWQMRAGVCCVITTASRHRCTSSSWTCQLYKTADPITLQHVHCFSFWHCFPTFRVCDGGCRLATVCCAFHGPFEIDTLGAKLIGTQATKIQMSTSFV